MSGWASKTSLSSEATLRTASLRVVSFALAVVYIGWNTIHLWHHQLAPSLFLAITNLPCPTTGATRAILALLHGNVLQSLRWNAMAVPYVLLAVGSFLRLATNVIKHHHLQLSVLWLNAWLSLLALGWAVQLLCYLYAASPS